MTMIELSVALSTVSGAIGGGLASGQDGFLAGTAGTAAGAVVGMITPALAIAATGLAASRVSDPSDSRPRRPVTRLWEVAFVLLVVLVCVAPVWVPFMTFHLVGFFAR